MRCMELYRHFIEDYLTASKVGQGPAVVEGYLHLSPPSEDAAMATRFAVTTGMMMLQSIGPQC